VLQAGRSLVRVPRGSRSCGISSRYLIDSHILMTCAVLHNVNFCFEIRMIINKMNAVQ
jgi:hypothetical protein